MEGPFSFLTTQHPSSNNRKRTHDRISDISTRQSPCTIHEAEASGNHSRSFGLENIRMPAIHRFRGDGLDMRRPVMSTQPSQNQTDNVIDLTEESPSPIFPTRSNVHPLNRRRSPAPRPQRGPRYERDIINIGSLDDTANAPLDQRESSPEVQFIRARPRSNSASSRSHRPTSHHPRVSNPQNPPSTSPERPRGSRRMGSVSAPRQARFGSLFGGWGNPGLGLPNVGLLLTQAARQGHQDELVEINEWPYPGIHAPDFDFGLQGFNLEHPSRPVERTPRLPTYNPPPAARAGFTRDLKEDDILVCPNCDDELGVGDNDIKRQVWVVKPCGHVYCGECARNRSANSKKTDPSSKSKPFKKCVVSDCGKTLSKSNMIQVYL